MKVVAADGVALAFVDHEFLWRLYFGGQFVGEFERRQLVVLAGLDQHRAFDAVGDRHEAEFLHETVEFGFVVVARTCT